MAYIGAGITRFNTADELTVTGDAQIDTTTLVVDSTNNRVGVGTASPGHLLHLKNNNPTIRLEDSDGASNIYGIIQSNGSGNILLSADHDDNAASSFIQLKVDGAEALRIDSSGNLLVGKTATGLSTTGFQALATGNQSAFISDGDRALILNRQTSDGSILEFHKDNTTVVGSIGTNSNGNFQLFGVAASHVGLQFGSPSILPVNNSGASSDNAVDLGDSNVRFKDGYFSNRIYTGGIAGENDTNTQITFPGSDVIKFLTGGGERMRIISGGNVGIGTTAPHDLFHVKGSSGASTDVSLQGGDDTNDIRLFFGGSSAAFNGQIIYEPDVNAFKFSTVGIERLRIDSSGNVLVGRTDTSSTTAGTVIYGGSSKGAITQTFAGRPLYINRLTTDGDIIEFAKDSTTVGSIGGSVGSYGYMHLGSGATGLQFTNASNQVIPYNPSSLSARDNAIDLGVSSHRFKDLYLSGGAYIGGTGSANKLDDYEEGSWTPSIYYQNSDDQTNSSNVQQEGRYVKIGTAVVASCFLKFSATDGRANDNIGVNGLPFVATQATGNGNFQQTAAVHLAGTSYPQGDAGIRAVVNPGATLVLLLTSNNGGNLGNDFGQNTGMEVRFTLTYITN